MRGLIVRFVVGQLELPGEKGSQILGRGPSLFAHISAAVVEGHVDEPLDALGVEAAKATREMPEAEHRITSHHRIAVARESGTTVLRKRSIAAFGREFENPVHQLHRIVPLERRLRNLRSVQLREPPIRPT